MTGECVTVICKIKLREFSTTGNKHYNFEDSLVSDYLHCKSIELIVLHMQLSKALNISF